MELSGPEKPFFPIGSTVSFVNEEEHLMYGKVTGVDEGTPGCQLVVEFQDGSVRHFTLDGKNPTTLKKKLEPYITFI